jgi:hypothetical protein
VGIALILKAAGSGLLRLLGAIPFAAWVVAGLCAWGFVGYHRAAVHKIDAAKAVAAAAEATAQAEAKARDDEYAASSAVREIGDALTKTQVQRSTDRVIADRKLRAVAAAWAASAAGTPAAAACRDDGAPAVAVLPQQDTDDLVSVADDADAVAIRLIACQSYVRRMQSPAPQ